MPVYHTVAWDLILTTDILYIMSVLSFVYILGDCWRAFSYMHVSYFRDESDDLIAALTGEDSSDDDDSSIDSDFERPRVRQRSNTGSSFTRRSEEIERVGREPTEGRKRKETSMERSSLQAVPSTEGDKVEASNQDQPAQSEDDTAPEIVPVSAARSYGGPYANAYRMWRKDASRWSMRAQLTALPHWVYRQYDTFDLARRAAGECEILRLCFYTLYVFQVKIDLLCLVSSTSL